MTATAATDTLPFRVADLRAVTENIRVLRLEPDGGPTLDWRPGQYARLAFADQVPRDYSIANGPGDGGLEIHVRRSGSGGVSDFVCDSLRTGDAVGVTGAFGAAYYRERHGGPLLAIAGGTGLAPMKAIVETALASGIRRDVHLYFGVRDETEIYLERHFIGLARAHPNFRFVTVIEHPREHSGRRTGRVGEAVAADFQLLYGHQCYLAGPPPMVAACRAMLKLKSVPDHDIFCDAFYTEAELRRRNAAGPG